MMSLNAIAVIGIGAGVAVLAVALFAGLIGLASRLRSTRDQLAEVRTERDAEVTRLGAERERERAAAADELAAAAARVETWIGEKTAAETALRELHKKAAALESEVGNTRRARDDALARLGAAETQAALRLQEVVEIKKRMADWETARAESLQAAKAAVLSTATEVSSKLLEDHKRESDGAKKEAEERVRKTTEHLLAQITDLSKSVAALNREVDQNRTTMDTVWKALSSPGGAGQFAEIGLENTLKSFGLEKGRDFVIQAPIDGRGLRPDAVVFLPGQAVLVIDSKASKFLLDLAEAEGTEHEAEAYRNLALTMNGHLRSLADRNYRAEIRESYRQAGRTGEIRRIMSIMYLPNDGAVEKLARADAQCIRRATAMELSIAGPSALACLIGFARVEIDLGRQAENHDRIIQGTQALLDALGVIVDHAARVGRGIKTAADNYVKLTASINSRLLPRMHGLLAHGVRPQRHGKLPNRLPGYQVIELESGGFIDGQAEEVAEQALEPLREPEDLALSDNEDR